MYEIDRDRVVRLGDLPKVSPSTPMPRVIADEHDCLVAYHEPDNAVVVVRFAGYWATMFGPPNDEAIAGHPLYARGLCAYGAFEVQESSWIAQLERMNSVHRHHDPARFAELRHVILTFHDSTFECAAPRYEVTRHAGTLDEILAWMVAQLRR